MEYLVMMDKNVQDQIHAKMVNVEGPVFSAMHFVNTVMEMLAV